MSTLGLIASIALLATTGYAQVGGSYVGRLDLGHPRQTVEVAAVLTEADGGVAGTLVLVGADATLDGTYPVQGRRKAVALRLRGANAMGTRLVMRGRAGDEVVRGVIRLRAGARGRKGRLTLDLQPPGDGGAACDSVFTQHEAFFTETVMAGVLVPICAACHTPGGQAGATRLRVVAGDPLATARSTTVLVDPSNPSGSLLLAKPQALVPHGGGAQLAAGSPEVAALASWVDLIAMADCSAPPPPTTGAGLFAVHCAGCHGPSGGGLDGRPDIRCAVAPRIVDATRLGRGTGPDAMPAFGAVTLSDAQLDLVIEHLDRACSGRPDDVYASNCATCHGAGASGGHNADGVIGPDIRCTELHDFNEALRGNDAMPAFPSLLGSRLSPLVRYVRTFCAED